MTRRIVLSGIVLVMVLALTVPALAQAGPNGAGPVNVVLDFQWIRQGQVGVVRVNGDGIAEARAVFQERVFYFYPERDGFIGLISASMERDVGAYVMQVWIKYADGTSERVDRSVQVNYGEFGRSEVTISASLMPLLEQDVNQGELDRLSNIFTRFTPERYWDTGFMLPSGNEQIGWFGAYRLYNGTYWYQHTGLDMRMGIGTSVNAAASGRVILSEMLTIRGGYVLIDHGWGIYTGYAHMSERFVVPGEWVRQGDVLGLSGNNGRSSGAHLHWEVIVGGEWVDPLAFLNLNVVTPAD